MAGRSTVTDAEGFGKELLAAGPDLLGSMVKVFAEAPMGAEADDLCNAEYGEVSLERVNRRNGYRIRERDTRAVAPVASSGSVPDLVIEVDPGTVRSRGDLVCGAGRSSPCHTSAV